MRIKKLHLVIGSVIAGLAIFQACSKTEPSGPTNEDVLDAPHDGATDEQYKRFLDGDVLFNDKIYTASDGLGPVFVSNSCGSCHRGDGKGTPLTTLTRFGQSDTLGNPYADGRKGWNGPQLQNRAIPGYKPETLPAGVVTAKFTPPIVVGMGYLQHVPDDSILAMSDPDDANHDGISGRPNYISVPDYIDPHSEAYIHYIARGDGKYIGRFGKKASVFNLLQQTVSALNEDIGIASPYNAWDVYTYQNIEPEITQTDCNTLAFYLEMEKAPTPRNSETQQFKDGKNVFLTIGCSNCHRESLTTGPSPVAATNKVTFHAYTDLLLHDMGSKLNDGYTEGTALPSEWRTAPLWGVGLSAESQGGVLYLLHDGRAHSFDEAIQYHGGEAQTAHDNYMALSATDKANLIYFLNSL